MNLGGGSFEPQVQMTGGYIRWGGGHLERLHRFQLAWSSAADCPDLNRPNPTQQIVPVPTGPIQRGSLYRFKPAWTSAADNTSSVSIASSRRLIDLHV